MYNPNSLVAPPTVPLNVGAGLNWPIVTPLWYGAKGDGMTDDTTAFNNFFAAIAGKCGYIPAPSVGYKLPSGLTISGHTRTRVFSDPGANLNATAQVSGYAVTINNCFQCDFQFGNIQCGYSGVIMTSSTSSATDNRITAEQITGAGRQSTKPSDPMANRIGFYIQGPSFGNANYYNTVSVKYISGFDTAYTAQTPSTVGGMNANQNFFFDIHCDSYWFGFYTNSSENTVLGARFDDSAGTDSSNLSEAVRIGDGTYTTNYNFIQGVAESQPFSQGVNCLANSVNNKIFLQDNTSQGSTDAGSNDIITHGSWNITSKMSLASVNSTAGTQSCLTTVATTLFTIPNATGNGGTYYVSIWFDGAGTAYCGTATLTQSGATGNPAAQLLVNQTGGSITISLSGQNVQVAQSSGSTLTCHWSYLFVNTP